MNEQDVDYYIVARRKHGPRIGRDRERRMEVWERAVLDVYEPQPQLRNQMLSNAVSVRLQHLRGVLEKAGVSNARECLEEVAASLFQRCDEAGENRPFSAISADREQASVRIQAELNAPGPRFAATTTTSG